MTTSTGNMRSVRIVGHWKRKPSRIATKNGSPDANAHPQVSAAIEAIQPRVIIPMHYFSPKGRLQISPVTEFTILAFSTEPAFWHPQSRHVATARPDQTGRFRIRGLPAGDYYLTAVDPAEQGEWYAPSYLDEHRAGAARVALGEGETKTQDFKVRLQ